MVIVTYKPSYDKQQQQNYEVPKVGSFIYALWDGVNSEEKPGWYLAKITSLSGRGEANLLYRSGGSTEKIRLSDIKWMPARGNGKWFMPPMTVSFHSLAKIVKKSREHKVKGFADNLTIINTNPEYATDPLLY